MQTTRESASIVDERAEQDEDAATSKDSQRTEAQRDRGGDQRAEDEEQDDDQERGGEQLGALGGAERFLLEGTRDAGVSGLGGLKRTVDVVCERSFQRGNGVAHRFRQRYVKVNQDQRPPRAGAQRGEVTPVPGRDDGRVGFAAQRGDQARALAFDRNGGAAEKDREG